MSRSEQELIRREKLKKLREGGYPYPNDVRATATCRDIYESAAAQGALAEGERTRVVVGGRLMAIRLMGKAAFCHIQDRSGRVQVYVKRDDVGEEAFSAFKTFDLGDIVEVGGYAFLTKTSEPSLHALSVRILVKCLHPLPEKWHGLTDVEVRYRQRYLDLIVNPDAREVFRKRSQIIREIRAFFDEKDYLEVETPVLNSISGGATARPFRTHHNTLDIDMNLRIALELPLKRLVVGGLERVYEIGRVFRNEGISTDHNPEFTLLEFYQAFATYDTMMDLTEELLVRLADRVVGQRRFTWCGKDLDLTPPFKRLSMRDAVAEYAGIPAGADLDSLEGLQAVARHVELEKLTDLSGGILFDYGTLLYEIFDKCVESKIVSPTFITQHPMSVSPLARPNVADPRFTDRFELFVAGFEVANAFSELNDPEDQEERFRKQIEKKAKGDDEAMDMDEDFVRALEYGLPPTGGEGIGIDRLVMILTGQESIRDVLLFPQMRPEKKGEETEPEK